MKKIIKTKNNIVYISSIIICLIILFLTIGFSSYQTALDVSSLSAIVRIQKDIRITNVSVSGSTSSGISNYEEYNVNKFISGVTLPNVDSTVSYDVVVTNLGNVEMGITNITGLPNNLKYVIDGYTLGDALCDDLDSTQCKLGSKTTIHITIGYNDNAYDSSNTTFDLEANFTFESINKVAKVGDTYYETLKAAIESVPGDDTETTVILLKNTSEKLTVNSGQNIIFNLQNYTVSNVGDNAVFTNDGKMTIYNGNIVSNAPKNGAINNNATGSIKISGGRIIATGGRQALYSKGEAEISGDAYLSAEATERAAVQSLETGTLTIKSGTIISNGFHAVQSAGTLVIGVHDGSVSTTSPLIQGKGNGIYSSVTFELYDGIIKGVANPFSHPNKLNKIEEGYGLIYGTEDIGEDTYKTVYLGNSIPVNFDYHGGLGNENSRYVFEGEKIGTLPSAIKSGNTFDGWWTEETGGELVDSNYIVTEEITIHAHWTKSQAVAQIGNKIYDTLQEAIYATPISSTTSTTITLLKDIKEIVTIPATRNIVLDLNDKKLNNCGDNAVIANNGKLTILNGNILSNADTAAIDNNSGNLTVNGTRIVATGTRQAIYAVKGTVEIIGDSYLSSTASGIYVITEVERGTIQSLADATVIIRSGTIVTTTQHAVSNEGTLIIGTQDENVDITSPVLIGEVDGVRSLGTVNFYDGIIKGKENAINGTVSEKENNYKIANGTETIGDNQYKTAYLELE